MLEIKLGDYTNSEYALVEANVQDDSILVVTHGNEKFVSDRLRGYVDTLKQVDDLRSIIGLYMVRVGDTSMWVRLTSSNNALRVNEFKSLMQEEILSIRDRGVNYI